MKATPTMRADGRQASGRSDLAVSLTRPAAAALRKLFRNRYTDAFSKTLMLFGVFHLAVLVLAAVRGNLYLLNAFRILNLDLVIPGAGEGLVNLLLSQGVVLAVYGLAYHFMTKPQSRTV